ncbi:Ankyrin repeat-containing protein [Paenibacillus sp. yr247]|uniref:ankyrin repeat domain-containing protein n=1 Tax=Paenibacillus sp. yr247 TaxID=1761880 RepID=UPI0008824C94|nr:ankyrin repeat domain-containing protein [Paenibacillus sp. yr247]SDO14850.1 Ankyrin repeat-containing protein [Paenibacillus sp. yr247]
MNYRIITAALSLILLVTLIVPGNAFAAIDVYVDDSHITFNEDPINEEGTTLVQFRPIFEKLGLNIKWDSDRQEVTGTKKNLEIKLTIGNKSASVNGVSRDLEKAPKIINGNTFIPLRFVTEISGGSVIWDGKRRNISIYVDKKATIHDAASADDVTVLQQLISSGLDVNEVNSSGGTPLISAALGNSLSSAKILLSNGAKVNVQDGGKWGWTPLSLAASHHNKEMVELFLNAGADPNLKDKTGGTPLMEASSDVNAGSTGHPELVKLLLNAGAKPNVADENGWTVYYLQQDVDLQK